MAEQTTKRDWYVYARLWAKVDIPDAPRHRNMCWEFRGHRDRFGYGRLKVGDRPVFAHRLALEAATGEQGHLACHHCHNPRCCNPAHLYWGTPLSNAADRARRRGKNEDSVLEEMSFSSQSAALVDAGKRLTKGEANG